MRRFELSEGTSNKFWQVEQVGAVMRVTFGRIGTGGQTQEKTFASPEAAAAEVAKLIREKTKKGYAEVGAAAPAPGPAAAPPATRAAVPPAEVPPAAAPPIAAPPAAAPPAAAPPAPPPPTPVARAASGSIQWTDAARRELAPIRGSAVAVARPPDSRAIHARLQRAVAALAQPFDAGLAIPGARRDEMLAARQAFSGPPPAKLDVASQAAAFALFAAPLSHGDRSHADDFVEYWGSAESGVFALRALCEAARLKAQANRDVIALLPGTAGSSQGVFGSFETGWRGLRAIAAGAADAEYAEMVTEARRAWPEAALHARALMAAGLDRLDLLSASDLDELRSSQWIHYWTLLLAAPDWSTAERMLRAVGIQWAHLRALLEIRHDLLARYGAPATALLRECTVSAPHMGADWLRDMAETIALAVSPDVAAFFVEQLESKELRGIASTYLLAHPELAFAPLVRAATGRGAAAAAVLKSLVAGAPDVAAAARGELSGAALTLVTSLEKKTQVGEEAPASALPRVLAAPPWLEKRQAAAPAVLALPPLPFEERIEWRPGEREARLALTHWEDRRPVDLQAIAQTLRQLKTAPPDPAQSRWQRPSGWLLTRVPLEPLLDYLPGLDLARLQWSYHRAPSVLIARHGLPLVGLALQLADTEPEECVAALERVRSPRVAPLMADAFSRLKKLRSAASDWLAGFPDAAAAGLIPLALGKPGKPRAMAEVALRHASVRGGRASIEAVAKRFGPDAERAVAAVLEFEPLCEYPAKIPKLPAWLAPAGLARPALANGAGALPPAAVEALLTMLAFSPLDGPSETYAGIAQVREACEPASLAEFAWDLFQSWLNAGAPSKDAWAFHALAHLGDDECARRLTPLIRVWPGEAAHQRAVTGLAVLAAMGTDVALMHLHGIAQKLKFKGLQEKAREMIDRIAEARGLSADELADRLVPDLGLDAKGSLALDYGSRSFCVVFDEALRPAVIDEDRKRLPDLPKPKQTDDAAKAEAATAQWKALKKDARTIAAAQVMRLEMAMCAERRWSVDVFRRFFLEHPLLVHLVRRLLWGVYEGEGAGRFVAGFRVAEDASLASVDDDPFTLAPDARVGLVHRLGIDAATAGRWGQVFADYEVLQPFPQLAREALTLPDAERIATSLARVAGTKVPTGKVLGLDARGWRRGPAQDGGVVGWYEKPLPGGQLVCMELEPGIFTGAVAESPEQTLGEVTLGAGSRAWHPHERLRFDRLRPIELSELLRELDSLKS